MSDSPIAGARRAWRVLERGTRATVCCERTKSAAFGFAGGAAGAPARISVVEPDGAERVLNSKGSFDAPAGSLVVFDVPGSGGYGPPVERDPERLREDLRDGYLAPEGAMRDYGVEAPAAATASDAPPGADRGTGPRLSTVAETPEAKA